MRALPLIWKRTRTDWPVPVQAGEQLTALAVQKNHTSGIIRVRCKRGWLSTKASDGTILLEEVVPPPLRFHHCIIISRLYRFMSEQALGRSDWGLRYDSGTS